MPKNALSETDSMGKNQIFRGEKTVRNKGFH